MSALIDDLTQSMSTLLASGSGILASTLRQFQAKVIAAIAVLEARARGNRIFYTRGVPADALGMEGDLGVNKDTGDFFEFTGGAFVFLFNARPQAGGGGGDSYTLPAATITSLGGVMVGEGLAVASNGVLSTPLASATRIGAVKVGTRLTISPSGYLNVPVASDTVAGVVKIDTNTLQMNNGVLSVNTSSGNISPAATPTNVLAVRDQPRTQTHISWDAMPGASLYQLYRQVNGGPWSQITIVPYNFFNDTSGEGQSDQFVLYRVTSANSAGESPASSIAQAQ